MLPPSPFFQQFLGLVVLICSQRASINRRLTTTYSKTVVRACISLVAASLFWSVHPLKLHPSKSCVCCEHLVLSHVPSRAAEDSANPCFSRPQPLPSVYYSCKQFTFIICKKGQLVYISRQYFVGTTFAFNSPFLPFRQSRALTPSVNAASDNQINLTWHSKITYHASFVSFRCQHCVGFAQYIFFFFHYKSAFTGDGST